MLLWLINWITFECGVLYSEYPQLIIDFTLYITRNDIRRTIILSIQVIVLLVNSLNSSLKNAIFVCQFVNIRFFNWCCYLTDSRLILFTHLSFFCSDLSPSYDISSLSSYTALNTLRLLPLQMRKTSDI